MLYLKVFTLFIFFQLFNAFNSRELGVESIFKRAGRNKIMVATFFAVFLVHLFIVEVCYNLFAINPLDFITWLKIVGVALSIIALNELVKFITHLIKRKKA